MGAQADYFTRAFRFRFGQYYRCHGRLNDVADCRANSARGRGYCRRYYGIGNSSFETYQEVWQNGKRCASGTSVQVYFNYQTGKSEPIPDNIKAGLAEHILPEQEKV